MMKSWKFAALAASAILVAACKTTGDETGTANSSGSTDAGTATGTTTGSGGATSGGTGTDIPALVNVNLQNVLNDLSVAINV